MFGGIACPQLPSSAPRTLSERELGALDAVLRFIDRHGPWALLDVTLAGGEAVPATEKVRAARGPLLELKIRSGEKNPRFLFVVCGGVAVFLVAFEKKAQKLRRHDVDRADARYLTIKDGCP